MSELELVGERIAILEEAVELIKERNKKVEIDKAWGTSRCRIL